MVFRNRSGLAVRVVDEGCHTFGSADNACHYAIEAPAAVAGETSSIHGVFCDVGAESAGSTVIGARGGKTAVHENSCVLLATECFVAVGCEVVCLSLPVLRVRWRRQVDLATCFGVHPTQDELGLIVHGEVEISRIDLDGNVVWSRGGGDIFTGCFSVEGDRIVAYDFEGKRYVLSASTGRGLQQ